MELLTRMLIILLLSYIIISRMNCIELTQLKYYEIISLKIKFNENTKARSIREKIEITVKFQAFRKDFELNLREDNSITSPSSKVFIIGKEIIKLYLKNVEGSSIYEGNVSGAKQSSVNGYLHENGFVGKIHLNNETYYTETASTYLKSAIYKNKLIIYKEVDILPVRGRSLNGNRPSTNSLLDDSVSRKYFNYNKIWESYSVRKSTLNNRKRLTCNLDIMADHTFVDAFDCDRATIIAEILYHVKVADKVFRQLNFNEDVTKGIRLNVEKITIIENANSSFYHLNFIETNATAFTLRLADFSRQTSCLSVTFCNREFNEIIGQAILGGVCLGSKTDKSYNIVFVTTLVRSKKVLKAYVSNTLFHEMGHSFGSEHDPPKDKICSPGDMNDPFGNYIMYSALILNYTDGSLYNNRIFSPCSKRHIYKRLFVDNAAFCMKKSESICGNGITEEGEECDCGNVTYCRKLDRCCNPPGSRAPCTILKYSKNFCSPREGKCCNDQCRFVAKEVKRKCFVYIPCREKIRYCNGMSPFCPEVILPDGTSCLDSKVCRSGTCTIDVCKRSGLETCKCPPNKECHFCCKNKEGHCKTATEFNIFKANREIYVMFPGTPCNNYTGECLKNGKCYVQHTSDKSISGNWKDTFWSLFLIPSFLTLFF
ncbi:disintegrin and metalloproteinase domain-containing protein 10-like [Centruroides sculpturatus]|uniref:disintegrin and metalloproteinase domain-containing protein 10-like n=1 Tax=Centruroides sculpturatus TaxID=218467 RepID=UPI000C6EAEE0|nr:disintegrin and metalloproteinase domain-containing protein 10-like [Centruroides sculpturatus]